MMQRCQRHAWCGIPQCGIKIYTGTYTSDVGPPKNRGAFRMATWLSFARKRLYFLACDAAHSIAPEFGKSLVMIGARETAYVAPSSLELANKLKSVLGRPNIRIVDSSQ